MILGYLAYVPDAQHMPYDDTAKRDTLQDFRPGAEQSNDFVILSLALSKWACDSVMYLWFLLAAICRGFQYFVRISMIGLLQIFSRILAVVGAILSFFGLGWVADMRGWLPALTGLHQKLMFKACKRAGMDYCEAKYGGLA